MLVFLAATTFAFGVMAMVRVQGSVKRRAAGIGKLTDGEAGNPRSLRHSSLKAAQRVIEYTTKHYSDGNGEEMKVLRRRMIAGRHLRSARGGAISSSAGPCWRLALAALVFFFAPTSEGSPMGWLFMGVAGIAGYIAPSIYIDRRIKARKAEHQSGFPDFMDLLVVCADAGLSMEASLERVGRELGDSYPSLTANIHMANLEIRAGRTMSRGAGASRRPARPRGGALVRDADPAVGGTRIEHHRGAARLLRRHAPQAAVARRGEGLQPAGQARGADDGVHLPGAVRGDPAAGDRAAHALVITERIPCHRNGLRRSQRITRFAVHMAYASEER